ncbi:uncharacterized protein LOC142976730 [Anticarsia gemmatalis]|uniref:uncharacterized protein LOC142976730 n=1 Tax=Anticarsia gemmatalis TaxID=129554 RepID=UPI003F7632E8
MSFLTVLLFISAFYFAQARPDAGAIAIAQAQAGPEAIATAEAATPSADDSAVPNISVPNYEQALSGFMEEMQKAMVKYLSPIMSKLSEEKQQKMMTMGMNGFASYANYMMMMLQEEDGARGLDDANSGFDLDRDDIILEFETLESIDNPGLIAAIPIPSPAKGNVPTAESEAVVA